MVCFRGISAVLAVLALLPSTPSAGEVATCLESADAVRRQHPGAWPSFTLRAAGQEGTKCWYPSTRASAHDHRRSPVIGLGAIQAAKPIEQAAAARLETTQQQASPLPTHDETRSLGTPPRQPAADVSDEPAAAGSIASEGGTDAAARTSDRSLTRDDPVATREKQGPPPSSHFAASAPDENEHLTLRTALLALIGVLIIMSIAAQFLVRSWGDTSLRRLTDSSGPRTVKRPAG